MRLHMDKGRVIGTRDKMIYGHFIEHFHRQIYGGVYDPGNPLSDEAGLRTDVLEAMRRIQVPVLQSRSICLDVEAEGVVRVSTLNGDSTESYNDIDHQGVSVVQTELGIFECGMEVVLPPHSVSVIEIGVR